MHTCTNICRVEYPDYVVAILFGELVLVAVSGGIGAAAMATFYTLKTQNKNQVRKCD